MEVVADFIVRRLCDAGVRTLFGVPGGGGNLDLIAAAGRAGLPFVLTSTETAGAIAAIAQAEITGAPGACLTTLGPGATSVANGVACALLERAPLIVFTDSQPPSAPFAHQRIDQRALMSPITKSSETLTAENALDAIMRALCTSTAGRPGPVHLDCPGGVVSGAVPLAGFGMQAGTVTTYTDLPRLEAIFATARKPLLIVGFGIRPAPGRLASFCDRHRIPAMVTYKAKGVVPDGHPWFAGIFTNATIEQRLIEESDLVIAVGLDPVELIPRAWTRRQPVVYFGPYPVEDDHVPFDLQVVDTPENNFALLDGLIGRTEWDASVVARDVRRQRDVIARRDDEGFTAQRVVEVAAAMLARQAARVTVDAGAHMFPATALWPVDEPRRMLISNGLSTMGFALPAAVGAALLERDRPVVALTGDGGLLMCLGELLTAARERLPIITIVFNDASLSLIEIKQQARQLPPAGVALGGIDWQGIARGFGVRAMRASNASELERTIAAALEQSGPALIDATIDRGNYGATLRAVRG
jgi:acetolactate synthase-1/2/3 large subunit